MGLASGTVEKKKPVLTRNFSKDLLNKLSRNDQLVTEQTLKIRLEAQLGRSASTAIIAGSHTTKNIKQ